MKKSKVKVKRRRWRTRKTREKSKGRKGLKRLGRMKMIFTKKTMKLGMG
jgi:hypothetical protein